MLKVPASGKRCVALNAIIQEAWGNWFDTTCAALLRESNGLMQPVLLRKAYQVFMSQVYYWSKETARTLEIAGQRTLDSNPVFAQFCLKLAKEEKGHERFAASDLNFLIEAPLTSTQDLIQYVRSIAVNENPIYLIGYDYWSEGSYHYFAQHADLLISLMELTFEQTSFFRLHSKVDVQHIQYIGNCLEQLSLEQKDWERIVEVTKKTIQMMTQIVESSISTLNHSLKQETYDGAYVQT